MIREVRHGGELLAVVISRDHDQDGLEFFTDRSLPLQMGHMKYPAGHRILPHVHRPVERRLTRTAEALVVRSGKVLVDLYTQDKEHVADVELAAQDAILLLAGGHGFKFLEAGAMLEFKQGPSVTTDQDKDKFRGPLDGAAS